MKTNLFRLPLIIAAITFLSIANMNLSAQVTVGSNIASTKGALLDLKNRQHDGTLTNALDPNNYTTGLGGGGLLLPRVILEGTHTLKPLLTAEEETDSLKYLLTGLMVYNIATDNSNVPPAFYPSVYTWDGSEWVASHANKVEVLSITIQPRAFSFNEFGRTDSVKPLTVTTSGGIGNLKYQWYMLSGYNVHVRVGDTLKTATDISQGSQGPSYTPIARTIGPVSGGTTDIAANCGLHRFYCVVEDEGGQRVESNTVEVAVGCGAKNNMGEWLSFMCFNLGAEQNISIHEQKTRALIFENDSADGRHYHAIGEDAIYGDLFQWGRIADSHQKRPVTGTGEGSEIDTVWYSSSIIIGHGNRCSSTTSQRPMNQVKYGEHGYGKFIVSNVSPYNWTSAEQNTADQLWRAGSVYEDPCYHYDPSNGQLLNSWHHGTDNSTDGSDGACTNPGAGWRLPNQSEWGELYKGSILSGTPGIATANTWRRVAPGSSTISGTPTKYQYNIAGGFQIMPDAVTSTLFLPSSGLRSVRSGLMYYQGTGGYYWSSSVTGTNAYSLYLTSNNINPAYSNNRAYGLAIRCIKNT
jgi:uncharacterized protein (TIGR02145 family)